MSRIVITTASLARSLGASSDLLKRLERAGLVVTIGRDAEGAAWVDVGARRQVERVQALIAAGYAERDIALVIGRAERSAAVPRVEHLVRAEELVAKACIEPATLDAWLESGALACWGVAESGEALYSRSVIPLARALGALEQLGLGDYATSWAAIARGDHGAVNGDKARELSARLGRRLDAAEVALRTLRKLLPRLGGDGRGRRRRRFLARVRRGSER